MDLTDTNSWEKLEGQVQTLWRVSAGIIALFPAGIGLLVEFIIEKENPAVTFPGFGLLGLGLLILLGGFGQWLVSKKYDRYRFQLGEDDLAVAKGVFWRSWRFISRNRVQHVDITSGPLARYLGLVEVTIYVGGMATAAATIPGLTTARGEELRKKLVKDVVPEPEPEVVEAPELQTGRGEVWTPPGITGHDANSVGTTEVVPPVVPPQQEEDRGV